MNTKGVSLASFLPHTCSLSSEDDLLDKNKATQAWPKHKMYGIYDSFKPKI